MYRKSGLSILIAALVLVLTVAPVMAAPPLAVHIEVEETIGLGTSDPFVASGPAVDAELVCPTGDVTDLDAKVVIPSAGTFRNLRAWKEFVCDDGSGTFFVTLVVRIDLVNGGTTAHWNVVGGTGAYAGLHGNGKLVGIPGVVGDPYDILDIYDGKLH